MSARDIAALGEVRTEQVQGESARCRVFLRRQVTLPDALPVGRHDGLHNVALPDDVGAADPEPVAEP